ncbi:uncharacterized protein Dvar_51570 [Desulfosarcina variabilis str. Montpellier]
MGIIEGYWKWATERLPILKRHYSRRITTKVKPPIPSFLELRFYAEILFSFSVYMPQSQKTTWRNQHSGIIKSIEA